MSGDADDYAILGGLVVQVLEVRLGGALEKSISCYHPCVTGQQFIERVREIGRSRGIVVRIDTMKGKGSHILLLYGDNHRTIIKDRRKELGAGLLSAMIRQLGLQQSDFR